MSYYRYITSVYKSDWPALNRTLRSSSCPRSVPDLETGRFSRASSVPPSSYYSNSFFNSATPFRDRASSVPPMSLGSNSRNYSYSSSASANSSCTTTSYSRTSRARSVANDYFHHSDLDSKVRDYNSHLASDDFVRRYVSESRNSGLRDGDYRTGFSSRYNYYDAGKHGADYLYKSTADVMGSWKHYNLSRQTISERNARAKSPLISRELDRYYETRKRTDYIGDISSGPAKDFRYYSYRRVPYFGGSDGYKYMKHKPRRN